MIDKIRLLKVSALSLAGKLDGMDEMQFFTYLSSLDSFTDSFPEIEKTINEALAIKDYEFCTASLKDLQERLSGIHADYLAKECARRIHDLGGSDHERIEANMTLFFADVSALSIDIQMAESQTPRAEYPEEKEAGEASAAEAAEESEEGSNSVGSDGVINILAVDDSAFFLNRLKTFFKGSDYVLTCVNSGKNALQHIKTNNPNIFILDIEMPGMDGYELAQRILEAGHKAPIIFLTANATKKNIVRAIRTGAIDFIVKPGVKEQVFAKVEKHIK